MTYRTIFTTVILSVLVVLIAMVIFGGYIKNNGTSDIPETENTITENTYNDPNRFVGAWVKPIPGQEEDYEGMRLYEDGVAESINMATLIYQSWQLENDAITLQGQSIGNGTTSVVSEMFPIVAVTDTSLILTNGDMEMEYQRMDEEGAILDEYELPEDIRDMIREKDDLIRIFGPEPGEAVESPLSLSGEARGYWFFEATAPVDVVDWDGRIIGSGYVSADSEWMTEEFVPFSGTISFEVPEETPYRRGAIIFKKANASGLPEHDDALEIPVQFK